MLCLDKNDNAVATEQVRYLAGFGVHAMQDVAEPNEPATYLHGDLIRSTMLTTDQGGAAVDRVAYTAFGELVDPNGVIGGEPPGGMGGTGVPPVYRYWYAGGYGYESGLITLYGENPDLPPIVLMHVGARWYQPGIGRFVQRDPIGLLGGLNVYVYCENESTSGVDPSGLSSKWRWLLYASGPGYLIVEFVYHKYIAAAEKGAEKLAEIELKTIIGHDMGCVGWPEPWRPRNVDAGRHYQWVKYTKLPDGRISVTYKTRDGRVGQFFITH